MLSPEQREKIENGGIAENEPKEAMRRSRVRDNMRDTVSDLALIYKNLDCIETERKDITGVNSKDTLESALLTVAMTGEECWSAEGISIVNGCRETSLAGALNKILSQVDHDDPTTPDYGEVDEFVELYNRLGELMEG